MRQGDWMLTYTGKKFYPRDPRPEDFDIEDIARALSLNCRFTGHCRFHYSVAQHSLLISNRLPESLALQGLLHDASEAYLSDMARPVKASMPEYRELEEKLMQAISKKYRFDWPESQEVKEADNRMLHTEKKQVLANSHLSPAWINEDKYPAYPDLKIYRWPPDLAEEMFLDRFRELYPVKIFLQQVCNLSILLTLKYIRKHEYET